MNKPFLFGSFLAAVSAVACCLGPLVLLSLGISGAWISNLAALSPYKGIFYVIALAFLGASFYKVYKKPKIISCVPGSFCASPNREKISKIFLWIAAILILGMLISPYVAPLLYN